MSEALELVRGFEGYPFVPNVRPFSSRLIECDPFTYRDAHRGLVVRVPRLICDGASVPKWCWGALKAGWIQLLPAGCLHDYLYRRGCLIQDLGHPAAVFSRGWADTIMVEAMASVGCSRRDQRIVRAGLWIGGRSAWKAREVWWQGNAA